MAEPHPDDNANGELALVLLRFEKTVRNTAKPVEPPEPQPPAKIIQLPLWPEDRRGTPNSFLRSALFAAIQGKTRRWMKGEFLGSVQGISVRFTGQQLDQSDLDVWDQAVHLTRLDPIGHTCQFTGYAFLKALGRNTGKDNYEWLDDAIERLVACAVIIESKEGVYGGNLISSWFRDKTNRAYKLTLNADTLKLYRWDDWTAVDWEQRQSLRGKALALWLHGFYSSHAQPYAVRIETLRTLSGSGTKQLRKFKQNLKTALADLEEVTGIKGTIDDDRVTADRLPSPPQRRHLVRKAKHTPRSRKQPDNPPGDYPLLGF
jgi:TrfA protein